MRKIGSWFLSKGLWIFLTWLIVAIQIRRSLTAHESPEFVGVSLTVSSAFLTTVFLLRSIPLEIKRSDASSVIAVALSYLGTVLILFAPKTHENISRAEASVFAFNLFFSLGLAIWGIFKLGSSFQVLPSSISSPKTTGPFQFVRHPIYTSYLLVAFAGLVEQYSVKMLIGTGLLFCGLLWRTYLEEEGYSKNANYIEYRNKIRRRFFSPPLLLPFLCLAAFKCLANSPSSIFQKPQELKIHLAYPILSLDPTVYDDWGSVFVGNHIYAPLITDRVELKDYAFAKNLSVTCANPTCSRSKIEFDIPNRADCAGNPITKQQITDELKIILTKKNWILPNWSLCHSKDHICLEFDAVPEVRRRIENLYFRFGWSRLDLNSPKPIGSGIYCLKNKITAGNSIESVILEPRNRGLPTLAVYYSKSNPGSFDLSIYGTNIPGFSQDVDTRTPLAYYIVKNPALSDRTLPWESFEGMRTLTKLFETEGIVSEERLPLFKNVTPIGTFTGSRSGEKNKKFRKVELVLPDFLTNCEAIAKKISSSWAEVSPICKNTSELIQNYVVPGKKNWDSFITPLTPGASYPTALKDQYFNGRSKESYVKDLGNSDSFFHLIGIGASAISVNPKMICDIVPRGLGLGDLMVTDIQYCD